jgi:hypothetical protein
MNSNFIRHLILLNLVVFQSLSARCGEGMWLPMYIDSLKLLEMQRLGFALGEGEIYSIDHPSLKDAVVIFGNGCTGEVISPDGLLITNYHCGFSRIQQRSTVERNYVTDGFWAASREKELPNPGLTVAFLVRMEEVTRVALKGLDDSIPEQERSSIIMKNVAGIQKKATEGKGYNSEVKSFFFGTRYFLFVYEVFPDVRLVGAPSESIGKFGGDTDNWIWPRHTGDFSLFRIYAGKDNKPAEYSTENVPYKPVKYLPLSLDGVNEGDFTLVIGYPGRTDEYLTSQGLNLVANKSLPVKVEMRNLRLQGLRNEMDKSTAAKLRFGAKYYSISNAWKKWIGVTKGVERSNAISLKQNQEENFSQWTRSNPSKETGYDSLLSRFDKTYAQYEPLFMANDLGNEFLNSVEIFNLAKNSLSNYYSLLDSSRTYNQAAIKKLHDSGMSFFRSGSENVDKFILPELLRIYAENTDEKFHPDIYKEIRGKYNNNYKAYTDHVFQTSLFTDSIRFEKLLKKSPKVIHKQLWTDPLPAMYREFVNILLFSVHGKTDSLERDLNRLYRKYITGLMAMDTGRVFYPDANFTMRIAFGKVEGYRSQDAVSYTANTSLEGVMEKENEEVSDYRIFPKLKDVYKEHDFGRWAVNGKVPVCFIASNHTSGGNSGSPVLNANGELVGINFDRNWEGTVSDYVYNPSICRNIALDVRYVLFIIDKVANASWLIDELTLVHHQRD